MANKILIELTGTEPQSEYRFHPTRKWRFDFAYPEQKIAIEIEGGTWIGGRHIHPIGFEKDCEKYNFCAKLGYRLLRYTILTYKTMFEDITAIERSLYG